MSVSKLSAGLIALVIGAAVVTALAANPETKPDLASAAAPQANAAPAAAKGDRLVRPVKPDMRPVTSACPQEPWPYGCQWRSPPARKVYRGSRSS